MKRLLRLPVRRLTVEAVKPRSLLSLCLLLISAAAAKTPLEWQTGVLIDFQSQVRFGQTVVGAIVGSAPRDRTDYWFTVVSGHYTYVFAKTVDIFDTTPHHTVNTEIQFAFKGRFVIVRDENGRNHRCVMAKRILNPPPQAAPQSAAQAAPAPTAVVPKPVETAPPPAAAAPTAAAAAPAPEAKPEPPPKPEPKPEDIRVIKL